MMASGGQKRAGQIGVSEGLRVLAVGGVGTARERAWCASIAKPGRSRLHEHRFVIARDESTSQGNGGRDAVPESRPWRHADRFSPSPNRHVTSGAQIPERQYQSLTYGSPPRTAPATRTRSRAVGPRAVDQQRVRDPRAAALVAVELADHELDRGGAKQLRTVIDAPRVAALPLKRQPRHPRR